MQLAAVGCSGLAATDSNGCTPLHYAAGKASGLVPELLARGAPPAAASSTGNTPLHRAATYGNAAAVSALLEAGAPLDVHGDHGWTPLHIAACLGHSAVVGQLLQAGADPHALDDAEETPLEKAGTALEEGLSGAAETGALIQQAQARIEVERQLKQQQLLEEEQASEALAAAKRAAKAAKAAAKATAKAAAAADPPSGGLKSAGVKVRGTDVGAVAGWTGPIALCAERHGRLDLVRHGPPSSKWLLPSPLLLSLSPGHASVRVASFAHSMRMHLCTSRRAGQCGSSEGQDGAESCRWLG